MITFKEEKIKRPATSAGSDSLRHFSDVFVTQRHPQVVVLVQQDLLLPRVPDSTGLVPETFTFTSPALHVYTTGLRDQTM